MNETTNISVLPEGCLSEIISVTSPGDACRAAAISKAFNTAADSDSVWERFLPPDYRQIIARAVSPLVFTSKKQLYLCLSESHTLLDHGSLIIISPRTLCNDCMIYSINRGYMVRARDLSIAWDDDPRYWEWGHVPESRFAEVAILIDVCWLDIQGKLGAVMLSPKTTYVAYLIFRVTSDSSGLTEPADSMVSFSGIRNETSNVYLQQPRGSLQENYVFPCTRKDGWMEIVLGEFYCDQGDDGEVEMGFQDIDHMNWKSGLVVEGFELRPK